jgi:hypothetical protein
MVCGSEEGRWSSNSKHVIVHDKICTVVTNAKIGMMNILDETKDTKFNDSNPIHTWQNKKRFMMYVTDFAMVLKILTGLAVIWKQ